MEPEATTAALGIIGTLLTAAGGLWLAFSKGWIAIKKADANQATKDEKTRRKIQDDSENRALEQWQELYNHLRERMDAIQNEHLQCQIELSRVKTRLHDLEELNKSLKEDQIAFRDRIRTLEQRVI